MINGPIFIINKNNRRVFLVCWKLIRYWNASEGKLGIRNLARFLRGIAEMLGGNDCKIKYSNSLENVCHPA